jgi:hypothetical protein
MVGDDHGPRRDTGLHPVEDNARRGGAPRVTAKHHTLDCLAHVGPLGSRDFAVEPQVAPAVKVIAEDLAKQIGARWAICAEGESENHQNAK